MGSLGAMKARGYSKDRYFQGDVEDVVSGDADRLTADRVDVVGAAVGVEQQWRRMASAGKFDVETVVALRHLAVDHCAEPITNIPHLLIDDGIEVVQHLHRIVVENGGGAQGVPDQCGHHRGVDALARDVAEEEAPRRAGQRKEIVEIAPDVVVRRREEIVGGVQAVGRGEHGRQQRTPQRLGEHPNPSLLDLGLLARRQELHFVGAAVGGVDDRDLQPFRPVRRSRA